MEAGSGPLSARPPAPREARSGKLHFKSRIWELAPGRGVPCCGSGVPFRLSGNAAASAARRMRPQACLCRAARTEFRPAASNVTLPEEFALGTLAASRVGRGRARSSLRKFRGRCRNAKKIFARPKTAAKAERTANWRTAGAPFRLPSAPICRQRRAFPPRAAGTPKP